MTVKITFKVETNNYHDGTLWVVSDDTSTDALGQLIAAKVGEVLAELEEVKFSNGVEAIANGALDDSTCGVCRRTFASPGNLKQHQTVSGHNGE